MLIDRRWHVPVSLNLAAATVFTTAAPPCAIELEHQDGLSQHLPLPWAGRDRPSEFVAHAVDGVFGVAGESAARLLGGVDGDRRGVGERDAREAGHVGAGDGELVDDGDAEAVADEADDSLGEAGLDREATRQACGGEGARGDLAVGIAGVDADQRLAGDVVDGERGSAWRGGGPRAGSPPVRQCRSGGIRARGGRSASWRRRTRRARAAGSRWSPRSSRR